MDEPIREYSGSTRHRQVLGLVVFLMGLWILPSFGKANTRENDSDPSEIGRSAIPIVGYDDKTGWLFGGAGFLYSDHAPGVNAGLFAVSNFRDFYSTTLNYERRSLGPLSFKTHLLAEVAFDNDYGQGDLTSAESPRVIRMSHLEIRPDLIYRVQKGLRLGVFGDFRARHEEGSQIFPDEGTLALGVHGEWDTRDKLINTRRGDFFQLELSREAKDGAFSQVKLDLRRFVRLKRDWTWANRLMAGTSLGQPSYLFRYSLGGLDLLRGYKSNRFRGREYFVFQEELRWIWTRWLSLNSSVDIGGIRDEAYHQLKASVQVGLRVGLPPDWGQKMRVDVGVGADQMTAQVQFGEVF